VLLIGLTAYGALLEAAQLTIPGRNSQALDVLADFAGAVLGVGIVAALVRLRPSTADAG
jgi:VanZ family protein